MSIFTKDPLQIIPFRSYGTKNHLYIKGRALEDENIDLSKKGFWNILKNTWKRFESDEIKNTPLTIMLPDGKIIETTTDNDGYFLINEQVEDLSKFTVENEWLPFTASYFRTDFKNKINNNNRFEGEVLIPSEKAEYGIISDIDDTILHTGVVSKLKWRLLINTFFIPPSKRKALEGSADFYQELAKGNSEEIINPIFYVSHSPWNMYKYLDYFLTKNKFPKGAILLRTVKSIFRKKKDEKTIKQKEIENILKTYTNLKFILIGDAGEYDADIYMDIVKLFPNQIKAIFLRSVNHRKKIKRIQHLIKDYKEVPFYLIKTSDEAIKKAKEQDLIK